MNRDNLKKNFESHGFQTSFFSTKEEAVQYLEQTVCHETVGFGGSMTVKEMELYDRLGVSNTVIWHWKNPGRETLLKAGQASVYILSANAVSETGELVNIDGTGNRLSASLYGPKRAIYVIGCNKIEPDLPAAIRRAKNVAAPKNALRLQAKTPCAAAGGDRCYDCSSPERICHGTLILERPMNGMETELLFIDETLGF